MAPLNSKEILACMSKLINAKDGGTGFANIQKNRGKTEREYQGKMSSGGRKTVLSSLWVFITSAHVQNLFGKQNEYQFVVHYGTQIVRAAFKSNSIPWRFISSPKKTSSPVERSKHVDFVSLDDC